MSSKSGYAVARIEAIQNELEDVKKLLEKTKEKKVIKLEGLWKGTKVSEKDIEKAKHSLFKEAYKVDNE